MADGRIAERPMLMDIYWPLELANFPQQPVFMSEYLHTNKLPSNHYLEVKMDKIDRLNVGLTIDFLNKNWQLFGYPEKFVGVINISLTTGEGKDQREIPLIDDQKVTFKPDSKWEGTARLRDEDIRMGQQVINFHLRFPKPEPYWVADQPTYESPTDEKNLYQNPYGADVEVQIGDVQWRVHSRIMAKSPVLKKILEKKMQRGGPIPTIQLEPNCLSSTMNEFIKCLYVGFNGYGVEQSADLLQLAECYDVPWLKRSCEKVLERHVTDQNVLQMAPLAYYYNCSKLMKICQLTIAMEPKVCGAAWPNFPDGLVSQLIPKEENVEFHMGELKKRHEIPIRHRMERKCKSDRKKALSDETKMK